MADRYEERARAVLTAFAKRWGSGDELYIGNNKQAIEAVAAALREQEATVLRELVATPIHNETFADVEYFARARGVGGLEFKPVN